MTYKTGIWGKQAQRRAQSRKEYFRHYRRLHPQYESHGTSLAYLGEMIGLKVLKGSKKINRPCDLNWKGKLVDVKTAKPTRTRDKIRWKFLLSKQKGKIDLFLLIRKDNDEKVIDIHLIPDNKIKYKNISISSFNVKKYTKYLLSL